MKRSALCALLGAAALAAAAPAGAQFVQLVRCQAAYPCSSPWGIRYNPDPLIAAHYGNVPTTAFSGRIDLARPYQLPALDISKTLDSQDFARDAARIFVLTHPTLKPKAAEPEPAAAPAAPEKD